ncbi:MAG TPA: thioredoxin domain-containing protein [Bryobacteraceae bacterium]|jgi:protein-disulfide isomerase
MKLAVVLLMTVSAWAQTSTPAASAGAKPSFDRAAFESSIRYYDLVVAGVTMKVGDPKPSRSLPGFSEVSVHLALGNDARDELYYIASDGKTVIPAEAGSVPAFNITRNPFQINLDRLILDNQPSFGPANAPVTIVEFGDLECPSCRAEAPILRNLLPMFYPNKVRVVFKDFPLESIHPWARAASDAARCVFHQNAAAFWKIYDWFYDTQDEIMPENLTSKVLEWAGKNGIDTAQLGRCIETKATDAEVTRNLNEAHAFGLKGTPTLFVNGRKIGGLDFQQLQQVIDAELSHQAKAH